MGLSMGTPDSPSSTQAFLRLKAISSAEGTPPVAESHLLLRPEHADPITASCAFSHRYH
jgi:hypothetical protein